MRHELIRKLREYRAHDKVEESFAPRFLSLLEHPDAFHRTHLPGHITGSAWIVDEDFASCLLVHHARLDRWLQPGGHADGDENVKRVATREVSEETGLLLHPFFDAIFDIDIHGIPEHKGFPSHDHYDVRFLFVASKDANLICSEESKELKWFPLSDVPVVTDRNSSILRMVDKMNAAVFMRKNR